LTEDDVLKLDYNSSSPAGLAVSLRRLAKNDYITRGYYDTTTNYLTLEYRN